MDPCTGWAEVHRNFRRRQLSVRQGNADRDRTETHAAHGVPQGLERAERVVALDRGGECRVTCDSVLALGDVNAEGECLGVAEVRLHATHHGERTAGRHEGDLERAHLLLGDDGGRRLGEDEQILRLIPRPRHLDRQPTEPGHVLGVAREKFSSVDRDAHRLRVEASDDRLSGEPGWHRCVRSGRERVNVLHAEGLEVLGRGAEELERHSAGVVGTAARRVRDEHDVGVDRNDANDLPVQHVGRDAVEQVAGVGEGLLRAGVHAEARIRGRPHPDVRTRRSSSVPEPDHHHGAARRNPLHEEAGELAEEPFTHQLRTAQAHHLRGRIVEGVGQVVLHGLTVIGGTLRTGQTRGVGERIAAEHHVVRPRISHVERRSRDDERIGGGGRNLGSRLRRGGLLSPRRVGGEAGEGNDEGEGSEKAAHDATPRK